MCPAGLQRAVRSRQVHQLKQGTHVGNGLPTLSNITDITNSLAEPHFKATRWVIGKLLKFKTSSPPSNTMPSANTILRQQKKTLNCRVWVNKIKITIFFYLTKRKKQETIQVIARARKFSFKGRKVKTQFVRVVGTVHFRSDIGV